MSLTIFFFAFSVTAIPLDKQLILEKILRL